MNEKNEVLTRKLEQLADLLDSQPNLTHVYMRRPDDVLVDVTRDQAKMTLTRHMDWTIEREQPGSVRSTATEPAVDPQPAAEDVQVPAKPSEEVEKPKNKKSKK